MAMPIAIAPTAMQRMAHPDGEVATAKGNFNQITNFSHTITLYN